MKISIDIDCTPEEARQFLGLPDVAPMQEALMAQIQEQMSASLASMEPETMMKTWLPMGVQGFEAMQKMFWNQMSAGTSGTKPTSKPAKE